MMAWDQALAVVLENFESLEGKPTGLLVGLGVWMRGSSSPNY